MKKIKLPSSYFNYISFMGTIILIIAWVAFVFLIFFEILSDSRSSMYLGMFTYLVTPGFIVLGFFLIAIGIFVRKRKLKKGTKDSEPKSMIINLNDKKTRKTLLVFISISIFFILSTIVGTYKGYEYTESVEFCGKLCHKVMNPEYVAYQNSPHARVKCAECHIGEGVDWFVKAKLSGLRQVYHYMNNSYHRPIETPIENLRPARETCEKCHWPQKFYTNGLRKEKYYLADSANTEWNVILNMKIGSENQAKGLSEGIHWHINNDFQIDYKANAKRDTVYWVKIIDKKTGVETVYKDDEVEAKSGKIDKIEKRSMDCMDCHNRPAHEFKSPSQYINNLFASENKLTSIPWLKSAAMAALSVPYTTTDSALTGIKDKIENYYKVQYPDLYKKYGKDILSSINKIENEFSSNTFPEMKANYSVYPRHIGHLETNGCFRCHNNRFKSPKGKVISKDCNLCHTIVGQGKSDSLKYVGINGALDFIHPVDIGNSWKESNCVDCHLYLYR